MKFPYYNKKTLQKEKEVDLNCGISLSGGLDCDFFEDGKNFYDENGILKRRNGLYTCEDFIIEQGDLSEDIFEPLKVQPQKIFVSGKEYSIGYTLMCDLDSYYKANIYLLGGTDIHTAIGNIYFNRTGEETFFIPEKILFYKGKKTNGAGIYALITLYNCENPDNGKIYKIYEISDDFSEWNQVTFSDTYIPTVYYNGRGNRYGETELPYSYNFDKPAELEPQNLLNERFYAYYNTDGLSNSFQLPLSDIDDDSVVCRYSVRKGEEYTWVIEGYETSNTITLFGRSITMYCNRETGTVFFYEGDDDYALPLMVDGVQNNLQIAASKTISGGKARVCSATGVVACDSEILLFSNDELPGEIIAANFERPLYFKEASSVIVGNSDEKITAVKNNGDNVTVFKPDGIYKLDIKKGNPITFRELISGVSDIFYTTEKLSVSPINLEIGCKEGDTVCYKNGRFIFKSGNSVIAMEETGGKYYTISDPIKEKISGNNTLEFAFIYKKYYALALGSGIYLVDLETLKTGAGGSFANWYIFILPEEFILTGAFYFAGEPIILLKDELCGVNYLSKFYGQKDICFLRADGEIESESFDIESGFIKRLGFPDMQRIDKISVDTAKSGEFSLSLLDSREEIFQYSAETGYEDKKFQKFTFYPALKCDDASIKLVWNGDLSVLKIKIYYR